MANFSTDENLLTWEPDLFRNVAPQSQKLTQGSDGVIRHSGTAVILSAATIGLVNAGITSGHVVYLSKDMTNATLYDVCIPVKSVATSTSCLLEAKTTACPTASSVTYRISSFDAQHENAHFTLCQRWGIDDDDLKTDNDEADLYNRRQLRAVSCYDVLTHVFGGQMTSLDDLYAQKSETYAGHYSRALAATKLEWDTDSDSEVDRTSRGGSIDLIVGNSGDAYPTTDYSRIED